jgi:hypothetical protein
MAPPSCGTDSRRPEIGNFPATFKVADTTGNATKSIAVEANSGAFGNKDLQAAAFYGIVSAIRVQGVGLVIPSGDVT